jgi:hypothetical protein
MNNINILRIWVAAVAISLAGFLGANDVLAQTFNHTDQSGVECEYKVYQSNTTYDDGAFPTLDMQSIVSMPTGLTTWIMDDRIVYNGVTYRIERIQNLNVNAGREYLKQLLEVEFPKTATKISITNAGHNPFLNLKKVTFGKYANAITDGLFYSTSLETVTFKGTAFFIQADGYSQARWAFKSCPATTTVIVPCGTKPLFVTSITNYSGHWNDGNWTADNFEEALCLKTITVLSNDDELGNAISLSGGGSLLTTTPGKTTAEFDGTATLYAIPKAGKTFVRWDDDVLENPRIITVPETVTDVTYTAIFAECEGGCDCEKDCECEGTKTAVEVKNAATFKVYPNPADNILTVEFAGAVSRGTLALYDATGKQVVSQSVTGTTAQLNISKLAAGVYVMRLVENGVAGAGIQVIKN